MVNEIQAVADPACGAGLDETELGAWAGFLRAHATLVRQLDDELIAAHQLPLTSFDVLVQIESAQDHRLRMSELADAVLLSRSGLTRLVARLVDQGLLERVGCESDARGAYAVLTDAGRERLAAARETHIKGVRERFLSRVSEHEQRELGRIWARLTS